MEDDLMRLFGSERIQKMMETLGIPDDEPIDQKILSGAIENAQKKVESKNFQARKNTLEYDDVMNVQRNIIYKQRRQVLDGENMAQFIRSLIHRWVEESIRGHQGESKHMDAESWQQATAPFRGLFFAPTEFQFSDEELAKKKVEDLIEELETVADTKDQPRLRNMLGAFLFSDDDVFKKVKVLSGGEKSRLALLKILLHPSNLLLLDEPTNHLDINAKDMLLEAIKNYEGTVIFVSHDKHFIKNLATRILYISQDGPEFFTGGYDYFEYKLEEKEAKWKVERSKEREKVEIKPTSSFQEMKAKRNKIRSLEKELESISKEIESLENEISLLDGETEKSEVYSVPEKIKSVMKKKEEKERILEEKEEQWLEKSEELEALNGENN